VKKTAAALISGDEYAKRFNACRMGTWCRGLSGIPGDPWVVYFWRDEKAELIDSPLLEQQLLLDVQVRKARMRKAQRAAVPK